MPDYFGTAGPDVLVGDKGPGLMDGRDGDDVLIAKSDGAFTLVGGLGDDKLVGGLYNDSLNGGEGADTLEGGFGDDVLAGGPGADLFSWATGHAGPATGHIDTILDWTPDDRLSLGGGQMELTYREITSSTSAFDFRVETLFDQGVNVVAVQVGPDVIVYADTRGDNGSQYPYFGDHVLLKGVSLAAIDVGNFVGIPAGPLMPPAPPEPTFSTSASLSGNIDTLRLGALIGANIIDETPTYFGLDGASADSDLRGTNFTYDAQGQLTGGAANYIFFTSATFFVSISLGAPIPATQIANWVLTDNNAAAVTTLLTGNDSLSGDPFNDLIRGCGGDDVISGGDGSDSLYGGAGNDIIYAWERPGISGFMDEGPSYLRGDEGDDYILGSVNFDDINGNMGNDTASGGAGDDWVVGGKDNDLLFGGVGNDIVYGNLGDDTCEGGEGADIVRGGQANDMVFGDAGNDFISGDRGDDTVSGGLGADIFHGSQDAGVDRVLDFSVAQGDRVQLDPGTIYTVQQVGADVVIGMGGDNRMILVGVQLSSLPPGWIFTA